MDDFSKLELMRCPHCDKVIKKNVTSYQFPPEILAVMKQLGINIKDLHH